jgi:hypothetical protein
MQSQQFKSVILAIRRRILDKNGRKKDDKGPNHRMFRLCWKFSVKWFVRWIVMQKLWQNLNET